MGIIVDQSPDAPLGAKIESCVLTLLTQDAFLLQGGVHEQTITGRLAIYLQGQFPTYHVDTEYNRHGVAVKTANLWGGVKKVKPDVVIHHRGNDDANFLVIEAKVLDRGSALDREHAHDKLAALVHGDEFQYRYGLFLEVGLDQNQQGRVVEAAWYVRDV